MGPCLRKGHRPVARRALRQEPNPKAHAILFERDQRFGRTNSGCRERPELTGDEHHAPHRAASFLNDFERARDADRMDLGRRAGAFDAGEQHPVTLLRVWIHWN